MASRDDEDIGIPVRKFVAAAYNNEGYVILGYQIAGTAVLPRTGRNEVPAHKFGEVVTPKPRK
jgi:hypothetical protein